jgi:hypothetical protein
VILTPLRRRQKTAAHHFVYAQHLIHLNIRSPDLCPFPVHTIARKWTVCELRIPVCARHAVDSFVCLCYNKTTLMKITTRRKTKQIKKVQHAKHFSRMNYTLRFNSMCCSCLPAASCSIISRQCVCFPCQIGKKDGADDKTKRSVGAVIYLETNQR